MDSLYNQLYLLEGGGDVSNQLKEISTEEIRNLLDDVPDKQFLKRGFTVGHVRCLVTEVEKLRSIDERLILATELITEQKEKIKKIEYDNKVLEAMATVKKVVELGAIIKSHVDIGEVNIKQINLLTEERDELKIAQSRLICLAKVQRIKELEAENADFEKYKEDMREDFKSQMDKLTEKLATSEKARLDAYKRGFAAGATTT